MIVDMLPAADAAGKGVGLRLLVLPACLVAGAAGAISAAPAALPPIFDQHLLVQCHAPTGASGLLHRLSSKFACSAPRTKLSCVTELSLTSSCWCHAPPQAGAGLLAALTSKCAQMQAARQSFTYQYDLYTKYACILSGKHAVAPSFRSNAWRREAASALAAEVVTTNLSGTIRKRNVHDLLIPSLVILQS